MEGKKGGKWCNFAFSTEDAPAQLKRLSENSKLPKERAVLSFVAATHDQNRSTGDDQGDLLFRIASDGIRLSGARTGYYACSSLGLLLVVTQTALKSGECYSLDRKKIPATLATDEKSGAKIIPLD